MPFSSTTLRVPALGGQEALGRATRPAPQLAPAIERVIRRTGGKPRTVTADRGYGEKRVDDALHELGVRNVVIPRQGRPRCRPPR